MSISASTALPTPKPGNADSSIDAKSQAFSEQVHLSYQQHPDFQFPQRALEVDPTRLASFNDAYALACSYGSRLSSQQHLACKRQCEESLGAVFGHLAAQTDTAYEKQFLEQLRAECERLSYDELTHFRSKPMVRGISFNNADSASQALELQRQRHFFGALPSDTVKEILSMGAADLSRMREAANQGRLTREELSINTGPVVRHITRLLNRVFCKQGVIDAVSVYMGKRMAVTGLALELSVPQATWWAHAYKGVSRAPKTLYAHVDQAIEIPKSIVYLTDVSAATGPTSCYPGAFEALSLNPLQALVGRTLHIVGSDPNSPLGMLYAKQYHQSMSSEPFRRHFMRLPPEIRFNGHVGWDVMPGSSAEQFLVDREHVMTGPAGTYIVFDGARLLHRGGMLSQGERIALQIIFSDTNLLHRVSRRIKQALP